MRPLRSMRSTTVPLAGYEVKGVDDAKLSKGLSGLIGVTLTFGIGMIVFGLLVRRNRGDSSSDRRPGRERHRPLPE